MFDPVHIQQFVWTLIYAALGILIFTGVFWLIVKICPFSIRKEIEEDQNVALGIIIGSVIVGMSIIIAAAIT
ncbi:MAG: DUF350 domain-containing protein [Pseudomonadota bacterium]